MRKIHLLILFIINSAFCFSQNQDIAIKHFKNKEFLKAAIEFEKLIPIGEYKFGVNSDKVIDYNYLAARSYQESNKLRKAIFFYTQTLQIIEKESKFDSKKSVFHQTIVFYMEALLAYSHEMYLSEEFYNLEQSLIRANNLYIKYNSIKIGKFNAFDKGIELGISKAYALLWGKTGNVIKYKGFTDRTLKLAKEYYGYNSIGYLIELNNSAKAYYDLYLFEESLIFCNELIELYDNNKHDNTILFIANLITKSGNLNKLKRYEEAIETSQNALSLFEKLPQRNRLPD
ncbi:MAG: hypothetical protein GYB35_09950, partial [Algicola sp.]|nr:hypothetical protein [Algicola sp.]